MPEPHLPPFQRFNLALQGGGSHGALTWGVLDALLEDGGLDFEGISGTSAGAMNAVALAHGFALAAAQFSRPAGSAPGRCCAGPCHPDAVVGGRWCHGQPGVGRAPGAGLARLVPDDTLACPGAGQSF
jgi:hypothetical protein